MAMTAWLRRHGQPELAGRAAGKSGWAGIELRAALPRAYWQPPATQRRCSKTAQHGVKRSFVAQHDNRRNPVQARS